MTSHTKTLLIAAVAALSLSAAPALAQHFSGASRWLQQKNT